MDDIFYDDPFGSQDTVTTQCDSLKTTGTAKLLTVIFIVDCSGTMTGERIAAVNAALQEVKFKLNEIREDNGLELKIAVMSFTSNVKWDLQLTPVEEVSLETINTRPGLTRYGAAFHELNRVLQKEKFMKHTGKIAPTAIMFLTDGVPTDDYQGDLDQLLENVWFANASRSAVLLGDAIHNDSARRAVEKFVNDPKEDIITADDSTVIIQKIELATMHTMAGDPIESGQTADHDTDDADGTDDWLGDDKGGDAGDLLGDADIGDPFGIFPDLGGDADVF